jgi:hypothetical protein
MRPHRITECCRFLSAERVHFPNARLRLLAAGIKTLIER